MTLQFLKDRRRKKILETPVPQAWEDIIDENVPHSRLLDEREWYELLGHSRILAAEKRFEGCGGLELTEEMKITISAWGALLLLGRETDYYPDLNTILVYPRPFIVPVRRPLAEGSVATLEEQEERIGESHGEGGPGTIVLAWEDVMKAAGEWSDGVNVTVHEFAHQLDQEDGELNGLPVIPDANLRERWVKVFQSEFDKLERESEATDQTLIDPYALTSTAEFFAVVMETFIEFPTDLEVQHPELYSVLREWARQDPAERWRMAEGAN